MGRVVRPAGAGRRSPAPGGAKRVRGALASGSNRASKSPAGPAQSPGVTLLCKTLGTLLLLAALATGPLAGADRLAARVILLANRDDPDSVRIAQHYAEARGVPAANILALGMPLTETISWSEFVTAIWQPLQDELVRRRWIEAIPMALTDAVGRRKHAFSGHHLSYLVVCRGVPLRIRHDPALYRPHPPLTDNPFFQTNAAAVDSELSLLAVNESPINAFLVNPLYRRDRPAAGEPAQVVKVSRLDGPTAADAGALVDRALAAERTGLLGRAYVDLGGPHPDGDRWLQAVAAQLRELGFDPDVDAAPGTRPATARSDAPALYFGWYAENLNGPFALPGFRFPAGAVAVHLHSGSATTLRSATAGWSGPLVARGVTATVGNVFEPYLQLLHRPDLLLRALARGDTFGDAAYYAEPVLSWQAIAIGDPLYRPFPGSFDQQWKRRAGLPPGLADYAVLRKMHLLEAAHQPAQALAVLQAGEKEHPSLALGWELSRQRERAGDRAGAIAELAGAIPAGALAPDEWALAQAAAAELQRLGAPAQAVHLYGHLLADPALPPELREPWLRDARAAALAAGEAEQATAWARELDALAAGAIK